MSDPASGRLVSLDVFRGITIAGMVLVNNPGDGAAVYPPLAHAEWHGWTPTDLVFPFFLFIVGVSITLALGRRAAAGEGRPRLAARAVRRSAIIFGLGLLLNVVASSELFPPRIEVDGLRIMGVLQRIALCYLAAAALYLRTGWRAQAGVAAALLLGYWGLLTLVPVPGFGAGDLGRESNLAAYLDRWLLGRHLWRGGKVYDPEGLLSTLPAIATTLAGVLAGHWLASKRPPATKLAGLAAAGAGAIAVGLAWGAGFPINKALWTSSYAVFTAGAALLGLAACYAVVDLAGYRRWSVPFVVLGVNALALFFLSTLGTLLLIFTGVPRAGGGSVTLHALLYQRYFAPWAAPVNASLAWAAAYLLLWLGLMSVLYRRRIFIRV